MKTRHENRGTCQACGRVHAIDPATGTVAKHGYRVAYRSYQGVCQGGRGRYGALEETAALNDELKATAERLAEAHGDAAYPYEVHEPTAIVSRVWNGEYDEIEKLVGGYRRRDRIRMMIAWEEATPEQRRRAQDEQANELRRLERSNRDYAKFLGELKAKRHGQPLYPAAEENGLRPEHCPGSRGPWEPGHEGKIYGRCSVCGKPLTRVLRSWRGNGNSTRTVVPLHKK